VKASSLATTSPGQALGAQSSVPSENKTYLRHTSTQWCAACRWPSSDADPRVPALSTSSAHPTLDAGRNTGAHQASLGVVMRWLQAGGEHAAGFVSTRVLAVWCCAVRCCAALQGAHSTRGGRPVQEVLRWRAGADYVPAPGTQTDGLFKILLCFVRPWHRCSAGGGRAIQNSDTAPSTMALCQVRWRVAGAAPSTVALCIEAMHSVARARVASLYCWTADAPPPRNTRAQCRARFSTPPQGRCSVWQAHRSVASILQRGKHAVKMPPCISRSPR
jgi:hypothetical protein